jgi:hypothetical protein
LSALLVIEFCIATSNEALLLFYLPYSFFSFVGSFTSGAFVWTSFCFFFQTLFSLSLSLSLFWWDKNLNSGLPIFKGDIATTEAIFVWLFWR